MRTYMCIYAHKICGGKGTQKIPYMQIYMGKSFKKVDFVTKMRGLESKSHIKHMSEMRLSASNASVRRAPNSLPIWFECPTVYKVDCVIVIQNPVQNYNKKK